ncbi:hypothetical protein [Deinococcus radiopugnans]|uniref:hypothetical protein n=1 Tax=Deinococcus radiopugnans TaxID=57497 RepID=UPI000A57BDE1|nr:hypothetical protein [Deinococcus radiopugnans]
MAQAPPELSAALERGEPASFYSPLLPPDPTEAARLALFLGRPASRRCGPGQTR